MKAQMMKYLERDNMKRSELIGQVFGRLTVVDYGYRKNHSFYWKCECSCPNKTVVYATSHALTSGNTQSCGCLRKELLHDKMSKYHVGDVIKGCELIEIIGNKHGSPLWKCKCSDCGSDLEYTSKQISKRKDNRCYDCIYPNLVGETFGRLHVDERIPDKKNKWLYVCTCSCEEHNVIKVPRCSLTRGTTQSCGCLKKEMNTEWGKQLKQLYPSQKKENIYIDKGEYIVGYALRGKMYDVFLIDKEDFPKMSGYTWRFNDSGYLVDAQAGGILARVVTDAKSGEVIDHIHGKYTRHDNRKLNLRAGDDSLNGLNKPQSDMRGIRYSYGKYRVRISNQKQERYLGSFETLEEAVAVRRAAEAEYGLGWRWEDHMNDDYDWLYAEIPDDEKDIYLPKGYNLMVNKSDLPNYEVFADDVGIHLYTENEVVEKQCIYDMKLRNQEGVV